MSEKVSDCCKAPCYALVTSEGKPICESCEGFCNLIDKEDIGSTDTLQLALSPGVNAFLDKLVETELYGNTRTQVAERLIQRSMEKMLLEEVLEKLMKD